MGLTAQRLLDLGLIDEILPEPAGGAHTDAAATSATLEAALATHLSELRKVRIDKLLQLRAEKYFDMGVFAEG